MTSNGQVERVLAITAHPDDIDFGAAGTIATWVAEGIEVSYCIVTDGDAGGHDPDVPREEIPRIRQAEQIAAAKAVGVTDVTFLGYPDGRLVPSLDLRRDIAREIRRARPQRVVCQSPERNFQRIFASHPDHLAAGEATLCAVYPDARNPYTFTELVDEGFDAWTVSEVWMMAGPIPSTHVDITDHFDRKVEALRAHTSQTAHMTDLAGFLRGWAVEMAKRFELPDGRLAEAFTVIRTA